MSALIVGYARCSTDQQDLTEHAPGLVVRDASAAGAGRPVWSPIHADAHVMSSAEWAGGRSLRLDIITSAKPPPSIPRWRPTPTYRSPALGSSKSQTS